MQTEDIKFQNSRGLELAGRIYSGSGAHEPGVIFSHGLFSSKDGYKITRMAESIVDSGFSLLTFDFTFSGESPGDIRDISLMDEVDDLLCAVKFFNRLGVGRIHLIGSSMGAAVSILAASSGIDGVESMILIAAPLTFSKLVPEINEEYIVSMDINGYTDIAGVTVNNRFIRELYDTDMVSAVRKIMVPSLVIHGRNDQVVDFLNLDLFVKNTGAESSTLVIDDGDHNLTRDSDIQLISEKVRWWLGKFSV